MCHAATIAGGGAKRKVLEFACQWCEADEFPRAVTSPVAPQTTAAAVPFDTFCRCGIGAGAGTREGREPSHQKLWQVPGVSSLLPRRPRHHHRQVGYTPSSQCAGTAFSLSTWAQMPLTMSMILAVSPDLGYFLACAHQRSERTASKDTPTVVIPAACHELHWKLSEADFGFGEEVGGAHAELPLDQFADVYCHSDSRFFPLPRECSEKKDIKETAEGFSRTLVSARSGSSSTSIRFL